MMSSSRASETSRVNFNQRQPNIAKQRTDGRESLSGNQKYLNVGN